MMMILSQMYLKGKRKEKEDDSFKATKIMRDLLKVASSLDMVKLSMEGNLQTRRKKFDEGQLRIVFIRKPV